MQKLVCDFCYNDMMAPGEHVKIPTLTPIEVCGGIGQKTLMTLGDEVVYQEKDICSLCAKKMAKAIQFMKLFSED